MAWESPSFTISREAGEDLSSKQYYLVKLDSNSKAVACTGVTDCPIGIIQNAPTSGAEATIMVHGVSKIVGGAALTINQEIGSDSTGKGTALTVAAGGTVYNYAIGKVIHASGAASGIGAVLLYGGGRPLLV